MPSYVITYVLRSRPVAPPDDERPFTSAENNAHWFDWACSTVEAVGDLDAFVAEHRRWQSESEGYNEAGRRRTEGVMWQDGGGTGHTEPPPIRYPEAMEIARLISTDLEPAPPAWAVDVEDTIVDPTDAPAALMSDDALDAALVEIDRRRSAQEKSRNETPLGRMGPRTRPGPDPHARSARPPARA